MNETEINQTYLAVRASSVNPARNIESITGEITTLKRHAQREMLSYFIEVGQRLIEAKAMLEHGEWLDWLKTKVEFSQPTASRMMQMYKEYGDALNGDDGKLFMLNNLSISKALRLIAIPEDERETFAAEHKIDELSTRELDALIKERDEALKAKGEAERERTETAAELDAMADKYSAMAGAAKQHRDETEAAEKAKAAAERQAQKAEKDAKTAQTKLAEAERAAKDAEDALQKLRDSPEIPEELLRGMQAKAEAAAEEKAEAVRREAEALRKQLTMSSPATVAFKLHFEAMQESWAKLAAALEEIERDDAETAGKLRGAIRALAGKMTEG
ncbi:MAG: DUF3102 domain-containing protein [Oscillospiraceae bacterium]|nr:DUF3102 domain-containing protein [Oscillospiraceae bacterium]